MIDPPTQDPDEPSDPEQPENPTKNGVVEVNGKLYYYINDVPQYAAGLIKLPDGSYIYVRSNAQLATGVYWVTNHNGFMGQGMYTFDDSGIMLDPPTENPEQPEDPEDPVVLDGVVDVGGTLYYYENGKVGYAAGLVQLVDEQGVSYFIYVRRDGPGHWPVLGHQRQRLYGRVYADLRCQRQTLSVSSKPKGCTGNPCILAVLFPDCDSGHNRKS
jgi:hypothetical protein